MSIAEEIALTGQWVQENETLDFLPDGRYAKTLNGKTTSGTYQIELDESLNSLVLDLFPKEQKAERYTFSVILNSEGTFLTLFFPVHIAIAHYKKKD